MEFITSDTHFNHRSICGPAGFVKGRRHFQTVEEMNETIVKHFNQRVQPVDHTYHLGDVALNMSMEEVHKLLCRLNGRFTIVMGNHDSRKLFKSLSRNNYLLPTGEWKYTFADVGVSVNANKKIYIMTHFPVVLGSRRKKYRNLCGHIHENASSEPNSLNIGVDSLEVPARPFGEPLKLTDAMSLVEKKWQKWYDNQHF